MSKSARIAFDPFRAMFAIALACLLAFLLFPDMISMISANWHILTILERISVILLISSLAIWVFGWIGFAAFEAAFLDARVASKMNTKQQIFGYMFAATIATVFALMLGSVFNPPLFIIFLAMVVGGVTIADHLIIRGISSRLKGVQTGEAKKQLVSYYLEHPHLVLHSMQLVLIIFAAAWYIYQGGDGRENQLWVFNATITVAIIGNEAVLWKWRLKRL